MQLSQIAKTVQSFGLKTVVKPAAGSWLSRLPLTRNGNGVAGTSPGVPGDILGSYEELRWMEPHMSSPSPCLIVNLTKLQKLKTQTTS